MQRFYICFLEARVIGEHSYLDKGVKEKRKGVNLEDIERILKESTEFSNIKKEDKDKNKEEEEKRSYKVYGDNAVISLNPDTNILIHVQPRR